MHPVLFEHAYGAVNAYGTLILLGTLASMPGVWWDVRGRGLGGKDPLNFFLDLYIVLFVGTIVGGRVLHVLATPSRLLAEPARLFAIESTGFVFYGSLFGIFAGLMWLARKYQHPRGTVVDLFATWMPVGHLGGRLGCFLAGCCHGAPWDGAWAVAFPSDSIVYLSGSVPIRGDHTVPLHPVQLYEALGLAVLGAWLAITRWRQGPGRPWLQASRYAVGYGVLRFVVELFRADPERGFLMEIRSPSLASSLGLPADHVVLLSTSQGIGIALVVAGIFGLLRARRAP